MIYAVAILAVPQPPVTVPANTVTLFNIDLRNAMLRETESPMVIVLSVIDFDMALPIVPAPTEIESLIVLNGL